MSNPPDPDNNGAAGGAEIDVTDEGPGGEIPAERWRIGVAFSLFLIVAGFVVAISGKVVTFAALAICIGFGIALAAFGGRASGRFLNFNIVGGGATAIALYILILRYPVTVDTPVARYVAGQISHSANLKDIRGEAKEQFLIGKAEEGADFRFIIFEKQFGKGFIKLSFDQPDGSLPREFSIACIKSDIFTNWLGRADPLTLSLQPAGNDKFRLIETLEGVEIGTFNGTDCSKPVTGPSLNDEVGVLDWLSIAAYAQDASATQPTATTDIPATLVQLESTDGTERDTARALIASLRGAQAYASVTGSWDITNSSYRADLGRLVAWSSAITQDRTTAVTLAETLSPAQLQYIVQLTGQGDITLRQISTEILHRLLETTSWPNGPSAARDQEIISATISIFAPSAPQPVTKADVQFKAPSMLFNTAVALEFASCNIGALYRPMVSQALSRAATDLGASPNTQKTVAKLGKVVSALETCH